jgi:hypothetical protein
MSDQGPNESISTKVTNAANAMTSTAGAASSWLGVIKGVWSLVCSALPALAISLFNYEESKIDALKKQNEALQLQLKLKENKDAVDQKYSGMSDADIVRQSILDSGGPDAGSTIAGVDPNAAPVIDPGPQPKKA